MTELIPVGSIIELKDKSMYMIVGFYINDIKDEEKYDYIACNPKTGFTKELKAMKRDKDIFFIKKEDISKILYIGYHDKDLNLYEKIFDEMQIKINEKLSTKEELDMQDLEEIYISEVDRLKEETNE